MDSLLKITRRPPPQRPRRSKRFSAIAQRKRKCDFCPSTEAIYRCSQCDLPFCSSECFRCERHRLCSEAFYKKCVLEHLKHTKADKEEQTRFLQLLKRNSTATNEDIADYLDLLNDQDEDDTLESISLDNILLQSADPQLRLFGEKLAGRLTAGNSPLNGRLDDAWLQLLDDAERAEFARLVDGNERLFSGLITEWRPWWRRQAWQRTVTEQAKEEDENVEDDEEEEDSFPCLYPHFERISQLTSKKPSPSIGLAIVSTVFAYCRLTRLYNGEIACHPPLNGEEIEDLDDDPGRWSVDIALELFRLCPLLDSSSGNSSSFVLENASQALELSLSCFLSSEKDDNSALQQKLSAVELLEDLKSIFDFGSTPGRLLLITQQQDSNSESASAKSSAFLHAPKAILLILSDLIVILGRIQAAQKKMNSPTDKQASKSLAKRIELARRKLLFYLSWSVEFGEQVLVKDQRILQSVHTEIVRLNQENLLFERTSEEVYEEEKEKKVEPSTEKASSKRVHFATPVGPLIEEMD